MVNGLLTRTKVENDRLGRLLKSAVFVIQKAAAPKNELNFLPEVHWSHQI